jgi:RNA polymerase sigma-70 factor (ECF subfamily)
MEELARILKRAAAGDETANRWLYRTYRRLVVRACGAFAALDADEVEDVVQETFVRALRNVGQLRNPATFEPWLLAITRNRALSQLARQATAARMRDQLSVEPMPPPGIIPEALARESAAEVVREVIAALPEGAEKTTAHAFYVQGGLSARELAEREGVGKSAVTMRLERFRSRVKRALLRKLLESRWSET